MNCDQRIRVLEAKINQLETNNKIIDNILLSKVPES
jgi:hypothetical protein